MSKSKNRCNMDIVLEETSAILNLFLQNDWELALDNAGLKAESHPYHAIVRGFLLTIKGFVTFEEGQLTYALEACQRALALSHSYRKKRSFVSKLFWSTNYDDYTEDEAHSEACYAASACAQAILTLVVEKSFIGLLKAGYYVKIAFEAMRESKKISSRRTRWESDYSKANCICATELGMGLFNLVVSLLPSRILKLVSFLGFPGNKARGLKLLESSALGDAVFAPFAALALLAYNTQVDYILGLGQMDLQLTQHILDVYLEKYSESGFFLFFAGALEQVTGSPDKAIITYTKAMNLFKDWTQFQSIGIWWKCWCYAIQGDWENAAKYSKTLRDTCLWSPCIFTYQYASFLHMMNDEKEQPDEHIKQEITALLREAPILKHSIAGKTIFMEKFVTKRCQIYFEDNETLLLPILELFLFWNVFEMMKDCPQYIQQLSVKIDEKLKQYPTDGKKVDKYLYLKFMKGVCLRYLGCPIDAALAFEEVLENEKQLTLYRHLPPQAALELGLTYNDMSNHSDAKKYLEKARRDYTHYLNETMVHLRVHCVLSSIKNAENSQIRGSTLSAIASSVSSTMSKMSHKSNIKL